VGGNQARCHLLEFVLAKAKPDCPYGSADQYAQLIQGKTGIPVTLGTHDDH